MGRGVTLISSADETAFEVMGRLEVGDSLVGQDSSLGPAPETRGSHVFITSGNTATFMELGARFLGPEVADVEAHKWS